MKLIKTISPIQWLKNGLIFIPAIFAAVTWNATLMLQLLLAFWGFSLIASSVCIHNDLRDKDSDQKHPEKKNRAIASNEIAHLDARVIQLIFLTVGLTTLFLISGSIAVFGACYVTINLIYSEFLKQIALIDLLCILSGYYIRLLIGQEIADAPLSLWIILMVGVLATYLVLIKRYSDVKLFENTGIKYRKTVTFYSKLKLQTTTLFLIHLIVLIYAAYIHFVFSQYPESFTLLPYFTIPLTYIAIITYHFKAIKNLQKDPISILIRNFWSVLLLLISFIILIITLYPNS